VSPAIASYQQRRTVHRLCPATSARSEGRGTSTWRQGHSLQPLERPSEGGKRRGHASTESQGAVSTRRFELRRPIAKQGPIRCSLVERRQSHLRWEAGRKKNQRAMESGVPHHCRAQGERRLSAQVEGPRTHKPPSPTAESCPSGRGARKRPLTGRGGGGTTPAASHHYTAGLQQRPGPPTSVPLAAVRGPSPMMTAEPRNDQDTTAEGIPIKPPHQALHHQVPARPWREGASLAAVPIPIEGLWPSTERADRWWHCSPSALPPRIGPSPASGGRADVG